MKLISAEVENFASYKHLAFDFASQGLALIFGHTGSGKSTLQDIPCWIMFGVTAKGGGVDEVRTWDAPGVTKGTLEVSLPQALFHITRIRGSQKDNDLFFTENLGPVQRGKDITETQALLNSRLGVTPELYAAAAYCHEFGPSTSFFQAKAKDRRSLLEMVASLDFPAALAEKTSEAKKQTKKSLTGFELNLERAKGQLEGAIAQLRQVSEYRDAWVARHADELAALEVKAEGFEIEKTSKVAALQLKFDRFEAKRQDTLAALHQKQTNLKMNLISDEAIFPRIFFLKERLQSAPLQKCTACGAPKDVERVAAYKVELAELLSTKDRNNKNKLEVEEIEKQIGAYQTEENPFHDQIEDAGRLENQYRAAAAAKIKETNPYVAQAQKSLKDLENKTGIVETLQDQVFALKHRALSLNQVYDLSYKLRALLLHQTLNRIQANTNGYLTAHFDAAIRITLVMQDSDKLEVEIYKDGHACTYTQLSKGQRGLLKLCFAVAVMDAAADRAGIKFDTLFFDEALDGLDADLKVKAYDLFLSLAGKHDSVFVIDHATELQERFGTKYRVSLNGGNSEIDSE